MDVLGVQPPAPSAGRDMLLGRLDAGNHAPIATIATLGVLPKPDRMATRLVADFNEPHFSAKALLSGSMNASCVM